MVDILLSASEALSGQLTQPIRVLIEVESGTVVSVHTNLPRSYNVEITALDRDLEQEGFDLTEKEALIEQFREISLSGD